MGIGLFLLSLMDAQSGVLMTSLAMLVFGVGATSGVSFFRTIGSSVGASVFGAIYGNLLASRLAAALVRS